MSVLAAAFLIAHTTAPLIKNWALHSSPTVYAWVTVLSPEIGGEFRPLGDVAWVMLVMAAVTVLSMQAMGGYRPLIRQSRTRIVAATLVSPLVALSFVTLILFALRSISWSRLFIFSFTAISAAGLCGSRQFLRWYRFRRIASGFYARNVMLIGSSGALEWMTAHFARSTSRTDYELVGYLAVPETDTDGSGSPKAPPGDLARCGTVSDLSALLVHHPIHEVIVIQGSAPSDWLAAVVETCDYFRITLRIVPEVLLAGALRDLQLIFHSDSLKLPEVVLRPVDFDSDLLFLKRIIDIVVSAVLLVLLLPLFAVIALAIKMTSWDLPVFYPWDVIGYKGRRFTGYKFTTMVGDADARKQDLMQLNEMSGPVFKIKNDPRITPLGRFLRKFSLNELPQLWSVLKGDMSLVGPRPAGPLELPGYEQWHKRKLCVRPGITCLWQVSGRNKISRFDDWVRMDLEYIDNWSLWLDFKILVWTAWAVIGGTGS